MWQASNTHQDKMTYTLLDQISILLNLRVLNVLHSISTQSLCADATVQKEDGADGGDRKKCKLFISHLKFISDISMKKMSMHTSAVESRKHLILLCIIWKCCRWPEDLCVMLSALCLIPSQAELFRKNILPYRPFFFFCGIQILELDGLKAVTNQQGQALRVWK